MMGGIRSSQAEEDEGSRKSNWEEEFQTFRHHEEEDEGEVGEIKRSKARV